MVSQRRGARQAQPDFGGCEALIVQGRDLKAALPTPGFPGWPQGTNATGPVSNKGG